jgi:2-polyprenyl-3-methyl-5-hydroxy-6-metoxy-1,4-benzoquinol methylase
MCGLEKNKDMDIEEYAKRKQFYNRDIPKLLLKYVSKECWISYLDLGCGDGSLLYAMNKKRFFDNKIVYAVDLSENRINLVKKINKNFICYVEDACSIKNIQNGSIDFLVSEQVIEHVKNDEAMIKEISRLLKKDGVVYLSTIFKKWYGWYFYRCNGRWTLDPTHLREYGKDGKLFVFFEKNGFEILENKKILIKRSLSDFILKRLNADREIYNNYFFLRLLRIFKLPIFGYYEWEIICKKK